MSQIKVCNKVWEIPESNSACEQWRIYFSKLKSEFGQENARMIWLITWQTNGSTSCTTNAGFNDWLKKNNIDVSSASTRAIADMSQIGSNILGFGKNITGMLQVALPATLGIGLIIVLYFAFKIQGRQSCQMW